jgi:hypothetical protein
MHHPVEGLVQRGLARSSPRGRGMVVYDFLTTALLPSMAGAAVGMYEPYHKGYPLLCYNLSFKTRKAGLFPLILTYLCYATIATLILALVVRVEEWFQYGFAAWVMVGFAVARAALSAPQSR